MITPEQSRAARGLLGWSLDDLVEASGISKPSISRFERGESNFRSETMLLLEAAFDKANIEFPDQRTVRIKADTLEVLRGQFSLQILWDKIFQHLKDTGGEILITNVDETRTFEHSGSALISHLDRLKQHNITERLLSCEGDTNFLMPHHYYRWISKELFTSSLSTYLFDGNVAFQMWGSNLITLIRSQDAYDAERERFEFIWKNAKIPPKKFIKKVI